MTASPDLYHIVHPHRSRRLGDITVDPDLPSAASPSGLGTRLVAAGRPQPTIEPHGLACRVFLRVGFQRLHGCGSCDNGRYMLTRFYYDIVCPYAYLAAGQIEGLAARTGATIEWCPVLLGGLLKANNTPAIPTTT